MDPTKNSALEGALKGLCCLLSATGSYFALCWIGSLLYIVSNPYDAGSAAIGIGFLTIFGIVGVRMRRIGLFGLLLSCIAAAFCIVSVGAMNADPLGQFLPVALCLSLLPLANAVLLRILLMTLVPAYGHEEGSATAPSWAAGPFSGADGIPAGPRAPTPFATLAPLPEDPFVQEVKATAGDQS